MFAIIDIEQIFNVFYVSTRIRNIPYNLKNKNAINAYTKTIKYNYYLINDLRIIKFFLEVVLVDTSHMSHRSTYKIISLKKTRFSK